MLISRTFLLWVLLAYRYSLSENVSLQDILQDSVAWPLSMSSTMMSRGTMHYLLGLNSLSLCLSLLLGFSEYVSRAWNKHPACGCSSFIIISPYNALRQEGIQRWERVHETVLSADLAVEQQCLTFEGGDAAKLFEYFGSDCAVRSSGKN